MLLLAAIVWVATGPLTAPRALGSQGDAELELRLRQAERKLEQGDTVGALLEVESVLSRDDDYWRAYFVRGRVQARMGDDLGARDSFTRAAELDPGNGRLHFLVASVGMQLADFETAVRQLEAAAQTGYDPPAVDALAAGLREYAERPIDLASIRAAPRVAVTGVDEGEGMTALVRELRTLLLDAREVALVPAEDRAHLAVRLTGSVQEGVVVEVVDRASGEVVLERTLADELLRARVEMGDLAVELIALANR